MHSSAGVPRHRKRPAKLSYTWRLQSALGWLNNSKFLHGTIWQPKAGARDTSLTQIAFVKQVWEEAAGPLQRQIDLLTSKQKCAVSDWRLIWEDKDNQKQLKYCWCAIKSIHWISSCVLHTSLIHTSVWSGVAVGFFLDTFRQTFCLG